MGICQSNLTEEEREARNASKKIDEQLGEQVETESLKIKMLLLGEFCGRFFDRI